jgi:hypothetical protein
VRTIHECRNILNYRLCRNLNAKCCTFCLCYDVYIQNVALCCSFISKIVSCIVLTGYLYGRRLQKTIGYSSNLEDTAIYREYIISKASLVPVHSDVQILFFYWTLELVRQCGIFGFIFLLEFRTGSNKTKNTTLSDQF